MTLSITASASWAPGPQVLLQVGSSPEVLAQLTVWRIHEDGSRHKVLMGGRQVLSGTWSGIDYHAPVNQTVRYQAETVDEQSPVSGPVPLVSVKTTWMIRQDGRSCSVDALVGPAPALSREVQVDKIQPLRSSLPVVRNWGPRTGFKTDVKLLCRSEAKAVEVLDFLAPGGPIVLNTPYRAPLITWMWGQPDSDSTEFLADQLWTVSFSFQQCRQPAADTKPVWTCDDVAAQYSTCDAVSAAFATCDGLSLKVTG